MNLNEDVKLLWDEIKQKLYAPEVDIFMHLIGPQYIEENIELKEEYINFLNILNDFREFHEETTQTKKKSLLIMQSTRKEFLEKEIEFMISNLRKRAKQVGIKEDEFLGLTTREWEIYQEIMKCKYENTSISTRPSTSQGSARPNNYNTAQNKMNSLYAAREGNGGDLMAIIPKKITILDDVGITEIINQIRQNLLLEKTHLLNIIEYIRNIIFDEGKQMNKIINVKEPTLNELQKMNKKLENQYLLNSKRIQEPLALEKTSKRLPSLVESGKNFQPPPNKDTFSRKFRIKTLNKKEEVKENPDTECHIKQTPNQREEETKITKRQSLTNLEPQNPSPQVDSTEINMGRGKSSHIKNKNISPAHFNRIKRAVAKNEQEKGNSQPNIKRIKGVKKSAKGNHHKITSSEEEKLTPPREKSDDCADSEEDSDVNFESLLMEKLGIKDEKKLNTKEAGRCEEKVSRIGRFKNIVKSSRQEENPKFKQSIRWCVAIQ